MVEADLGAGAAGRVYLGFMKCANFARRAFSVSWSSCSMTAALRLRDKGGVGTEARRTLLAIRVRLGSGSRHSGGAVDTYSR